MEPGTGMPSGLMETVRDGRQVTAVPADGLTESPAVSAISHRHLLELLPVAVYTCDCDGYITFFNEAAVALWGRRPELGKDLWCGSWKIFEPDGITPVPLDTCPMAVALKEGRTVTGKMIIVERPDGARKHVLPHPQPLRNAAGEVTGAVNMLMDITTQQLAEQALRENEERLRLALEAGGQGTWELDLETGLVKGSPRHRQILGYTPNRAWTMTAFLAIVHPDDRLTVEQSFNGALSGLPISYEVRVLRPNGAPRWIKVNGTTIYNEAGQPIRLLGTVLDITGQKTASGQLEKTVQERTRELRHTNRQLEKSNHALEQFAYIASHDLQEPLRKIRTFTELLKNNLQRPEVAEKYFSKISGSASRMSALIDDVLNYSRLSRTAGQFQETDLNEVLHDVLTDFDLLIEQQQAVVTHTPLPVVKGIPPQLRQLFANLIGNSLKFSDKPPRINISASLLAPGQVPQDGPLKQGRSYVSLRFADNGIGFDQQYAEQIFVIFRRLNSRSDFGGTGIGLALCRKIVENHRGAITAEGKVGEGAVFTILLPA